MHVLVFTFLITLTAGCKTGKDVTVITNAKDTLVWYKKDTAIATGHALSAIPLHLPQKGKIIFSNNSKLLLLLDKPAITAAPEGVYEIYLVNSLKDSANLSSTQESFVSLPDLYAVTAPGAKQQLEIDITNQVKRLYETAQPVFPLFAVLKFAPIRLANGTYSKNAGEITFAGLSIVQVN